MESRVSLKIGHVRSKTRFLGQILGKHYVWPRSHITGLILMKLKMFALMKSHTSLKLGHVD